MPVIRRSNSTTTEDRGNRYTPVAGQHSGAMELIVVRTEKEPGAFTVAHSHDHEEIVVVLSGRASFNIGPEFEEVGPGDTLIIPPGALHQGEVIGDEPLEALLVKPAGIRFFDEEGAEYTPSWWKA